MPSFSCSAILFDLDGVLLDSTRVVAQQYTRWALENGLDPAEVMKAAHGVRTLEVVQRVAPHLDAVAETRKIEDREAALLSPRGTARGRRSNRHQGYHQSHPRRRRAKGKLIVSGQ